jgi:hypothetical protein
MAVSVEKQRDAKVAALRARISSGGTLNPETLAQSYGLPLEFVRNEVAACGGPYGKKG